MRCCPRIRILCLEQLAPCMRPALRVDQPGFLGVVFVGGVAIGEQDAALDRAQAEGLLDICLLYTSDAADERSSVDLGGCRIIKKKKTREMRIWTHLM